MNLQVVCIQNRVHIIFKNFALIGCNYSSVVAIAEYELVVTVSSRCQMLLIQPISCPDNRHIYFCAVVLPFDLFNCAPLTAVRQCYTLPKYIALRILVSDTL